MIRDIFAILFNVTQTIFKQFEHFSDVKLGIS